MKRILFLVLLLTFGWSTHTQASHLMGGEITWECFKTGPNVGKFQFKVKLYRDCNGVPGPGALTLSTNAPGFAGGINCALQTQTDISPVGPGCPTCINPMGYANAVEEFVYLSGFINITGVPPAGGWYFAYTDCCRNGAVTNLAAGSGWFTLRAIMFPYNATNTNPCFDSSPQFAERPQLSTCTGNTTSYNHNAIDVDLDSLVYDWGRPLDNTPYPGSTTNYPYNPNYTFNSPLPGPAQNAGNIAAVMNPINGVVTFTSFTAGAFVTVTKVTAYKCNIKVAEVYREIQIALIAGCIISPTLGNNTPPDVTDALLNPISQIIDTVYAGDTVELDLFGQDFEAQAPGTAPLVFQQIALSATGPMFGTNFTNEAAGCPYPPCAVINSFTNQPTGLIDTVPPIAPKFSPGFISFRFRWITDCNHLDKTLGCVTAKSVYNFVFKVFDNFCPSPAVNFNTLTIVVLAPPPVGGARMKCADVLPNGNVNLTFLPPVDTGEADTNQFFKKFYVYRSATGTAGPYALIDSLEGFKITNYDTVITYLDGTANANAGSVSYYLTTRSGCDILDREVSDTISTMYLNVTQVGSDASLTWTPLSTPLHPSTTRKYYVYRESPPAGSGIWSLIDSTTSLNYLDPVFVCDDSINYQIRVRDTSVANCTSRSNIDGAQLQSAIPNITSPSLRCVSVLANGDIRLNWVGSIDTAQYFAGYNVYQATNPAGPFTNIGFVSNYNANTFTHIGANGQTVINYYYLTTSAGCDAASVDESTPPSDTLASMLLTANNPTVGFANISWTPLSTPLPATSTGIYNVYRRIPPTVAWTLIGDTTGLSYQDTIVFCDTIIEYMVEIADGSGCISTSSIDGNNFTSVGDIIDNAELRCLAVQANGDVQLSFIQPADPNNFFAATEIYHSSTLAGPYTLVGTVTNIATTTWTHVGANANTANQYYYVKTRSGCDGLQVNGFTSDTLRTILLTVSNANLGFADLTWNNMHTPALASAPGPYRVMRRSTGVGVYVQIGTTNNLTFRDTISTCNVPFEYRIELDDNMPCTSISSADNDVFTYVGNIIGNPTLRCVSVLANGNITLTWENPVPSSFTNFNEYEIWRNGGAGFTILDSVSNSAQGTFTDITANGNIQPYSYYLVTQSGCTGQATNGSTGNTLSSIYLTAAGVLGQANLNWTPLTTPLPLTSVTGQYTVYSTYNAPGTMQLLGDTVQLVYFQNILDCDTTLSHEIRVDDNFGCTSKSNITTGNYTFTGNIVNNPDLRCVSVLANGQIQLTWITPTGSSDEFNEFEIYRDNGTGFVLYDSISNFNQTTWTDAFANGNNQSYAYYMRSQSGCTGQLDNGATSATLNSIYLTSSAATLGQANLNWNAMPLLATSAATGYNVWSSYPSGAALSVISSTLATTASEAISDCDTTLRHQISVADNSGCVSLSNVDTNTFTWIGNIVNNPDLRCVSVLANGQVQLTWITPTGSSADFNEFEIYRDNGTGFVLYDSISNFNQTTWTDAFANGNNQSYAYYMRSQSGCTGQADNGTTSATLNSIYLTSSAATLGQANLNWNAMPLLTTSAATGYDVWSSYPSGAALSVISSTLATTASEAISDCDTTLRHQISVADNSGCVSLSNVDTNTFTWIGNVVNNPDLRCVSVLANGQIQLTWITPTGSSADFNEFEIYRDNGTGFVLYDSISNFNQTTWTDAFANGNNQSYAYYMRSQSGCTGQVDNGTTSSTLNSIYLTSSAATLGQANLNWNAMPLLATSAATGYDVWSSYPSGAALSVISSTLATTASEAISDCDTTLRHQISVADNSGCVSLSNVDTNTFSWIGNIVNNPDLRCVSVLANGQIQLTWITPTGSSAEFNEFEIYRNNGTGFVLYDSISNFNQTTWTDAFANGNSQSYAYYMRSQSGCTGQVDNGTTSATLNSIYLTSSAATLGQANLNWNAMPLLATSAATGYDVWSSYPSGAALSVISSTLGTTATEAINDCDTTLRHQISVADNSGCVSLSNVDTNTFTYIGNIVNNPDLRCVSVLPNGQVQLTWITPTGSNVNFNEFEIYRDNGTGFVLYDSISNFNQTTWTDALANGNNQSYAYYMRSQSGCTGQVDNGATSATLNSIYVTSTGVLGQATINWNAMPLLATSAATGYDVWSSYPTGTLNTVITSTLALSATEAISNCDTTLLHQVRVADNSGCTSISNVDTNVFTYIGNVIDHPELRCASVLPNGQVQLTWVNPTPTTWDDFNQINIWRNNGAGFVLIDSIEVNNITAYLDATANGNAGSVSYYLQTKSGCTGQTDPSAIGGSAVGNTLSTIYLVVSGGNTTTATLNWNAVSNPLLATSTGNYLIEREYPGGSGNWSNAATVTTTTWSEPLTLCIDSVNYRVSIGDAQGCNSMSNVDGEVFVDHSIPDAPSARCASVQTNGHVVLNWIVPTDTGQGFANYKIYSSSSINGPYSLVTTITNYNTATYTDITANAQAASVYYYITTQTSCGGETSPGSDTLRTIKVDVINNNGVAIVNWNPIHNPELATATQNYTVYKEYPAGVWSITGTTTAPVYQWFDTINVCQAVINYRVETGDGSGCISNSSTDGDLFRDVTRPNVALLDTVSLDPLNPSQVSVSWLPSSSGDVVGYIIYHFNGASWDSIGSVTGINASYFLDNNPAADLAPQRYSLAAYDSCGNVSNLGTSHNTLFITAKLDICRSAIDVRWNPYINMVGGVGQYNVYVSENNGPYTFLASVPGTNVTYSHTTLNNGSEYCYYVQAQGNTATRTASSNTACEIANLLTLPTFSYLKKATVIDLRRVVVECLVDTADNPDVSRYKLQRAFDKTGPFITIGAINYTGQPIVTFNDFSARTDQYSYYYRVITIDSCGNDVLISNVGRTILLKGQADFNLVNKMNWNFYEEWLGDVNKYSLFRSVDGVWSPTPIATVNNGVLEYDDDVAQLYQYPTYSGKFCYRIEAYEGPGNTYGFSDTSSSNIFCLVQEPHLFIPSAFTPDGKNPIFKPEFVYIDAKNYYFVVFNRWGQLVYETRMPGEGWDGTYQGKIAPEGTYAYTVRIFGTNGQEIEKSGSVTLLR